MKNSNKTVITSDIVKHIAKLAQIPVTDEEEKKFANGFTKTLEVVDKLNLIDVTHVEPTHQVTGLSNIFREDEVNVEDMFSQEQALSNSKKSYKGFFVVDQILEQE